MVIEDFLLHLHAPCLNLGHRALLAQLLFHCPLLLALPHVRSWLPPPHPPLLQLRGAMVYVQEPAGANVTCLPGQLSFVSHTCAQPPAPSSRQGFLYWILAPSPPICTTLSPSLQQPHPHTPALRYDTENWKNLVDKSLGCSREPILTMYLPISHILSLLILTLILRERQWLFSFLLYK